MGLLHDLEVRENQFFSFEASDIRNHDVIPDRHGVALRDPDGRTQEIRHFRNGRINACTVTSGYDLKHVAIDAHRLEGFNEAGRGLLYGMQKTQQNRGC